MTKTKTVDGTIYMLHKGVDTYFCKGCAAECNDYLCRQLGKECGAGGIWIEDTSPAPRVNQGTKKHNEVTLAICNYQQLAQAVQRAGGCIDILETHTVPQLLETLARNNITLQATYGSNR